MTPILTTDYFWGNLQLQFLNVKPSNADGLTDRVASGAKRTEIDQFISKYEIEALYDVLGVKLADEFVQGLSVETPDTKWTWLKDQIYNTTAKTSFVANYVWIIYSRYTTVRQTARATIESKVGKAQTVSNTINEVDAWNEFVKLARRVQQLIKENDDFADVVCLPRIETINEFGI